MYYYKIFGLTVGSEIALDILRVDLDHDEAKAPDIVFKRGEIGHDILPMFEAPPVFDYEAPEGVAMIWPGVGGFRIHSPKSVTVQPFPTAPESYLAFPILGPIIGWLLHIRGISALHASALHWNGISVGFMGDKMAGKSTTAAAFIKDGASLITDDLLAFDQTEPDNPSILPAFAQLKLTENSLEAFTLSKSEKLPLVFEGFEKQQIRLHDMHTIPAKCHALFVLTRKGDAPKINWYDGGEGLKSLMRYSYNVRFGNAPLKLQNRAKHFRQYASLSQQIRIGELCIPAGLERLCETVDYVRQSLKEIE